MKYILKYKIEDRVIERIFKKYAGNIEIIFEDSKNRIKIKPDYAFQIKNGIFVVNKTSASYIDLEIPHNVKDIFISEEENRKYYFQILELDCSDSCITIIFNERLRAKIYDIDIDEFNYFISRMKDDDKYKLISNNIKFIKDRCGKGSIKKINSISGYKNQYNRVNHINSILINVEDNILDIEDEEERFENIRFISYKKKLRKEYIENMDYLYLKYDYNLFNIKNYIAKLIVYNSESIVDLNFLEYGFMSKLKNLDNIISLSYNDCAIISDREESTVLEISYEKTLFKHTIARDSKIESLIHTGIYDPEINKMNDEEIYKNIISFIDNIDKYTNEDKAFFGERFFDENRDFISEKNTFIKGNMVSMFHNSLLIHNIDINTMAIDSRIGYMIASPYRVIDKEENMIQSSDREESFCNRNCESYYTGKLVENGILSQKIIDDAKQDIIKSREEDARIERDFWRNLDDYEKNNLINMMEK